MVSLPRENFSVRSMDDAKFFIEEYIPAGTTVRCRDVFNAGRGYAFQRDSKGEINVMKVQYGDDTVRGSYTGENAVAAVFDARESINSKWFANR